MSDALIRILIASAASTVVIATAVWGRAHQRRLSEGSSLDLEGIDGSVLFFTDAACLRCAVVRSRLDELGVSYVEIAYNHEPELQTRVGVVGVPLVVVRASDGSITARLAGAVSRRRLRRAVRSVA